MAQRLLLHRDCLAVTSIFQSPQLIGSSAPGGGAPPEAEVAAARSGAEVARWERFGGRGVGGGSSAG